MKKTIFAATAMLLAAVGFTSCDKELEPKTFDVKGVQFTMVPVKAGTFKMGWTEELHDSTTIFYDEGIHQVTLTQDFYIGETEVTQALWEAVMGSNPMSNYYKDPEYPIANIKLGDIEEFLKKLNELTKEEGMTFTLPSEAQWEYAARGGDKARPTRYSGSNDPDSVAWLRENSELNLHKVKQLAPNEIGAYDMTGNVSEACADFNDFLKEKGDMIDPLVKKGDTSSECNVIRGGDYHNEANRTSVADRTNYALYEYADNRLGFRLCITLPKKD